MLFFEAVAKPKTVDSLTFQHPKPLFGNKLNLNHSIHFPYELKLGFEQSGQAQLALMLKSLELAGKNDKSHLVFVVDMIANEGSPQNVRLPAPLKGLTDALSLCNQTVDTVVKGHTDIKGLPVLQAATGKRYITQYATIEMGPTIAAVAGPIKDARARLRLFNENQRNLEWLLMQRTGKTNKKQVQHDLQSGETFNALKSLAYGKNGLVDAVIVGHDQLLTRPVLDAFYGAHSLSGKQNKQARDLFNRQYKSMDEVITWAKQQERLETFHTFAPGSLCPKPMPIQKSILDKEDKIALKADEKDKTAKSIDPKDQKIADLKKQIHKLVDALGSTDKPKSENEKEKKTETKFHFHKAELDKKGKVDLDRNLTLTQDGKFETIEIQQVSNTLKRNTFARDTIIFPGSFTFDTLYQLESALGKVYEKKEKLIAAGKSVSNALIVENSPGGHSIATEQIKSKIESASIPTDVLVQGWGCSGGSKLVTMATGNRFATPNSSILLHETRGGDTGLLNLVNKAFQYHEYLGSSSKHLVAKRTGRPYEEVDKDFRLDFELNAVESMVYGPNGLIDAILVAPDKVLTRNSIMDFIIEKKGSPEAAQAYIEQKFIQRRESGHNADINEHQEINEDPLANPLQMIHELVNRGKSISMDSEEKFKNSVSDVAGDKDRTMHIYKIFEKKKPEVKK